jgi:hypothetical protein
MKTGNIKIRSVTWLLRTTLLFLLPAVCPGLLNAQVNPPRPIGLVASSLQSLNFGIFSITGSSGGTVTVSNTGIRSSTGDIFLTGSTHTYGIFTIDVVTGTSLYLMNGPTATLTGSNGGQMTMNLGETYPGFPYTTISSSTVFQIGATLIVGPMNDNPPGDYYGTYEIIINHQ